MNIEQSQQIEQSAEEIEPIDRWPFWKNNPPFTIEEKERLHAIQIEWEATEAARRGNQERILQKIYDVWNDSIRRTSSKSGQELEDCLHRLSPSED